MKLSATPAFLAVCLLCSLAGCRAEDSLLGLSLDQLLRGSAELGFARYRRLNGGSSVTCSGYAGHVVITANNLVICEGLRQDNSGSKILRVIGYCKDQLIQLNSLMGLVVYGLDGGSVDISKGTFSSATDLVDGSYTFPISDYSGGTTCPKDATTYQSSMKVQTGTCQVVSYGGTTQKNMETYSSSGRKAATLEMSPFASCCSNFLGNLLPYKNFGENKDFSNLNRYACAKSTVGICNGDLGAPIYCDTESNGRVVIGMVATGSCTAGGEHISVVDFTGHTLTGFSA